MKDTLYTVLYVDDEDTNLRLFKKSFRRDFNIIVAKSAKEALAIIEKEKIDVLITDQRMPEMTGVELLESFNKLFPQIPPQRMIVSGYSLNSDIAEAFDKYQLYKFIEKPWDYNELKSLIFTSLKNNL